MNAYIISGYRTAVTKAQKGGFRFTRSDDLASEVIKYMVKHSKGLDPQKIDDVIVGCAVPEAEQGMQMGRIISLLSMPLGVPGMIVNRYCGSGLEAINIAAARIHAGMAECIIAGGTESMSMIPMLGWKTALNYQLSTEHADYYSSMGVTAEQVATKFNISREDQDEFSYNSHIRAINAIKQSKFKNEIVPVKVEETYLDNAQRKKREYIIDTDEGPRTDTSMSALAKLKPAFMRGGTVTAGNSSQTSDGAAFVIVVSERMLKELNVQPMARLMSYAAVGVEPRIMGIGPVKAVPKALKKAGIKQHELDIIELNEAFAAQSLAVIHELSLDMEKVNVNGGAIALGHPLGCTGAKLSVQAINEVKKRKGKYGMVTACVGGGQGVAGIYEVF